jgi:hypothetical protein
MGAHPYWYFVDYEPDHQAALEKLRTREFDAGRYNPVEPFPDFPVDLLKPSRGAGHATIDQAREASDADGTRSILDIDHVGEQPDFVVAARLDDNSLDAFFGTTAPTHEMVESSEVLFKQIERGHAIYIVVYRDGNPDELFFAGYSFD